MDELYEMKLHDVITPKGPEAISILRVPGGWVYSIFVETEGGYDVSNTFVPYDNEFQVDHDKKG